MAILVTGAGLVGGYAVERLLARGAAPLLYDIAPDRAYLATIFPPERVPIVRGDVRDLPHLMQVVREHAVDVIVHTAGLIGGNVEEAPFTGLQINLQGTINVLETARVLGVRRVVFASTESVYDAAQAMDADAKLAESAPYGYNPLYGAAKAACELLGHAYAERFGVDFIALRLATVFGAATFAGGSVAGEYMHALVGAAVAGRPVRVPPWPGRREFVYVRDAARAIERACFAEGLRYRVFNVGVGYTSTAEEIAAALRQAEPAADVALGDAPHERMARAARNAGFDTTRARDELGWTAEYNLAGAFRDYAAILRAGS